MESKERNTLKLHRLVFFTDAVYAIILTLLVIEIHVPDLSDANSPQEMLEKLYYVRAQFLGFLLCFLVIWQGWMAHNAFSSLVTRFNNNIASLNFLGILPYCLLPFAASLIGNYPYNPMSFVFFGSIMLFSGIFGTIQLQYTWRNKLLIPEAYTKTFENKMIKPSFFPLLIIVAGIGSAYISTILSFSFFTALLLTWIYMTRYFKV